MGKLFFYSIFFVVFLTSCVDEDINQCESNIRITMAIKDKAYFNEAKKDTNDVFSDFVNTIHYTFAKSKKITEEKRIIKKSKTPYYELIRNKFSTGNYSLFVCANGEFVNEKIELHPENQEHTDLFTYHTLLQVTYPKTEKTGYLSRVKGKLRINCENFPADITQVSINVNNIFRQVDANFNYEGVTHVKKQIPAAHWIDTYLAPTPPESKSYLNLGVYTGSTLKYSLSNIPIVINRNKITELTIKYGESGITVSSALHDGWDSVANLTTE